MKTKQEYLDEYAESIGCLEPNPREPEQAMALALPIFMALLVDIRDELNAISKNVMGIGD